MFETVKAGILPGSLRIVSGKLISKMCVSKKIDGQNCCVTSGEPHQIVAVLHWAAIEIQSSLTFDEIKIYEELKFSAWI